jgi:hypothetical protein
MRLLGGRIPLERAAEQIYRNKYIRWSHIYYLSSALLFAWVWPAGLEEVLTHTNTIAILIGHARSLENVCTGVACYFWISGWLVGYSYSVVPDISYSGDQLVGEWVSTWSRTWTNNYLFIDWSMESPWSNTKRSQLPKLWTNNLFIGPCMAGFILDRFIVALVDSVC